jgi:hypothetical protein
VYITLCRGIFMSELLKFIMENFKRLQLFDYVLLLLISILTGFSLFLLFRWLYSAIFKKQSELLKLRDEEVKGYKNILGQTQIEGKILEGRLSHLEENYASLSEAYEKTKTEKETTG